MKPRLIRLTLATALVLCWHSWSTLLPLAEATQKGGPLENATVSFGAWQSDGPLDRFPIASPGPRNQHELIPYEVTIKAGGAVNFIIGGFHQIIVYDAGTRSDDIDTESTVLSTGVPNNAALIDDAANRIYRGLDPSRLQLVDPLGPPALVVRDRVEVVHFSKPGTYLVICGIRNHFVNDGMFGFVRVLP